MSLYHEIWGMRHLVCYYCSLNHFHNHEDHCFMTLVSLSTEEKGYWNHDIPLLKRQEHHFKNY